MITTQLIIIGAGPGGYETAIAAAEQGLEVVLIESNALGGTCLNEGCIPTKCLCRSAEIMDDIKEAGLFGAECQLSGFNLAQAMQRKNEVVNQLCSGIAGMLKKVTVVNGKAEFDGPTIIKVNGESYTAPNIIIATGSEAKLLPIEGATSEGVLTAREMLQLETLPQHLCVIGGGVIGLEFASIFKSFGSEVTVVEYAKEILPGFDKDIAKRLRTALKKRGINFNLGAAVNRIQESNGKKKVTFDLNGKASEVEADLVLMAVGRGARLKGFGLESTGVEFTPKGIVVDEWMRTNVKGIYAVGDVNGRCQLAHAATAQGKRALANILGMNEGPNLDIIPAAVFTNPEVATVGLSEEAATNKGIHYTSHKAFYRANGKSLAMGSNEGLVKILVDDEKHIIGAHILGAHAADLIHELALAIHTQRTVDEVNYLIHAHPSLSEIVHDAITN